MIVIVGRWVSFDITKEHDVAEISNLLPYSFTISHRYNSGSFKHIMQVLAETTKGLYGRSSVTSIRDRLINQPDHLSRPLQGSRVFFENKDDAVLFRLSWTESLE